MEINILQLEYDDDPFRCYNRYAKPLNLLLWHHVICQNTPYNEIQDLDLINCLHPAIDSYIFLASERRCVILKSLSKGEERIETYSKIVSKSEYDQWIDYFRRTAEPFDVSPLFVESYWKNLDLKKD